MNKKQTLLASLMLSGVVIMISIVIIPNTVKAKDTYKREKQVISVKIEEGDSLWSIAKEYMTNDYKNMNSFIKEIKRTNGLTSDTIHAGGYLIAPHYIEMEEFCLR